MRIRLWRYRGLFASGSQKTSAVVWFILAWASGGRLFSGGRSAGRKAQSQGLVAALLFATASLCSAFEQSGHQVVAQLMTPYLNSAASAELERLFGAQWQQLVVRNAGNVQAEMSRPKNQKLAELQFTLFDPEDEGFEVEKHCANGVCSVAAVLESEQVLLKPSFDDTQKRQAFWYLMHYNLQLHIPLNCGLIRDQGGRKIYLDDDQLKPVNLSFIWNYDLYRKLNQHWFSYAKALSRKMEEENKDAWLASLRPRDWAYETNRLAIAEAYPLALDGRYSAELINRGQEILEMQLMKAAYRAAALLNELFPEVEEQGSGQLPPES
ncbi:S1/P1 nuclease [Reinekea marinisedimentorum]|uniref:S1/P1 nuclease n=1 Tax=Reinekea marinisedimentorum TaxID=230495 RepID=A0A4R3HTV4_9GAMM|nr:S1/P1 nuclease [Reinekea marinisedimentorum]